MGRLIKQRTSWAIRFDLPVATGERKQRQISGFRTKGEAKKALTEIENKLINNTYITEDLTIDQMFEVWFQDYVNIRLAPKTQLYYTGLYENYIKPYFEYIYLKNLRANIIEKFYDDLKRKGASDDIIFKCHKTLRACLNKAYKWSYAGNKIMDRVTSPKEPKADTNFWEPPTIKKALAETANSSVFFHICTSLHLGLRLGEVCALVHEDVDFNKKVIRVNKTLQYLKGEVIVKEPKTESSKREIPLTHGMLTFFRKAIKKSKENQLFMGDKYNKTYINNFSVFENGDIMTDSYVTKRFKKDIEKLDLPSIRFHDLRHSCASWLISNDVDLKTVQEILGHAEYSTTANIYAHVTKEKKKQALEKLGF